MKVVTQIAIRTPTIPKFAGPIVRKIQITLGLAGVYQMVSAIRILTIPKFAGTVVHKIQITPGLAGIDY